MNNRRDKELLLNDLLDRILDKALHIRSICGQVKDEEHKKVLLNTMNGLMGAIEIALDEIKEICGREAFDEASERLEQRTRENK